MALIKCYECNNEVSTEALNCPHCGAPKSIKKYSSSSPSWIIRIGGGFLVACLLLIIYVEIFQSNVTSPTKAACENNDLSCLGNNGIVNAGVYCKSEVEKLAKHSVKWTDDTFETKFDRFKWKNKSIGTITYIGDKAEFQNGFSAFTRVIYECDLASDNKTVLDVRVSEGHLKY